jgi:hypothetical protein
MTERINCRKRNAELIITRHSTNKAYRIKENERNAASMATRGTDPSYRLEEN